MQDYFYMGLKLMVKSRFLRVAFISRYPPAHCGVAEYTRMLISALVSVAPWVSVIVFSTKEYRSKPYVDDSTGAIVYPCYNLLDDNYDSILDYLAEVGGVDILHLQHEYGIYGESTAVLDAIKKAVDEGLARRSIVTMHTVYHPYSNAEWAIEFQASLNRVDSVIVHSPLQEFELYTQGVESWRIHRIPHGTLINPYIGSPRRELCRRLGVRLEESPGMILCIPGFIRRDKGLNVIAESLEMINSSKVTLLLAGEVKDVSVLEEVEASIPNGRGRVLALKRYLTNDEILMLTALSDAIVLPYIDAKGKYAVSGILHLSMGSLKPIIGSRVPRLIELYQRAPRLTVAPGDPGDLACKIEWLAKNYDYAVAYMAELYAYAARTQWTRMARRHLEHYKRILSNEHVEVDVQLE